jgi:hypothetical protein
MSTTRHLHRRSSEEMLGANKRVDERVCTRVTEMKAWQEAIQSGLLLFCSSVKKPQQQIAEFQGAVAQSQSRTWYQGICTPNLVFRRFCNAGASDAG